MRSATAGKKLGLETCPPVEVSEALAKILKPHQWSIQAPDRLASARDCNSKGILQARAGQLSYPPQWIVWPDSNQDVIKIVKMANRLQVPLIPFGGGSGVCGGTWAIRGGIALDLKRMDRILSLDTRKMQVRVQGGIIGEILERFLERKGLTLGHFPSSIYAATVGGYLACRSAGQYSSYYGKIEDMVEGLTVILPNGELLQLDSGATPLQGMDLKELFLGSEGTLGVITEGLFRIHPKPDFTLLRGLEFPNLEKSFQAAREIMQRDLKPMVLRIYDPLDTKLASSHSDPEEANLSQHLGQWLKPLFHLAKNTSLKFALSNPKMLKGITDWMGSHCKMILGFHGMGEMPAAQQAAAMEICKKYRGKDLGPGPGLHWLKHRYSVSYKLSPLFDEGFFADTMEVASTWKNLTKLYHGVRNTIGKRALVLAHFSHAYPEGCSIYFTFVAYHPREKGSQKLYDQIWEEALQACHQLGGTISHHHGIGLLKAEYMAKEWGQSFDWLCALKQKLDPKNIFNPGKLGFPADWKDFL